MMQLFYSYISKENHDIILKDILSKFSKLYKDNVSKFVKWEDVQLSILGRALLFYGLNKSNKSLTEKDIKYTKYDKPYFENNTINFNISHSGKIVTCLIIDGCKTGIDIEKKHSINIEDFKRQMTTKEWASIHDSSNRTDAFFKYWTQKEAAIKAHGQGLSMQLKSFEINDNKTDIEQETFFLKEVKIDSDYICFIGSNTLLELEPINIQELTLQNLLKN